MIGWQSSSSEVQGGLYGLGISDESGTDWWGVWHRGLEALDTMQIVKLKPVTIMWGELGVLQFPAKDKVKTKQQIALRPFLLHYGDREEPERLLWDKIRFDWGAMPAPVDSTVAWMGESVNTSSYKQKMSPALLLQKSPAWSSSFMKKPVFSRFQSPPYFLLLFSPLSG